MHTKRGGCAAVLPAKRDFSLGTFEHCTGFLVGQGDGIHERPLSGVKWTWLGRVAMSANDPKRTSALIATRRPIAKC